MTDSDPITLPLLREELVTAKRAVETGRVRVQTRVVEEQAWVRDAVARENVSVERHAIGRVVDRAPSVREEGAITIIPVVEEQLVIEKRLVLVEEIRIVRETRIERIEQPVTLRRQVADVDRLPPTPGD